MHKAALVFRAIDLDRHASLCVEFRADSYVCGDGDALRFWATAGPNGQDYLGKLATYMKALSGSCVHAWLDNQVVGQIEMIRDPSDASAGKVNLFYLRPDCRERGLGAQLEAYALWTLRDHGFTSAWLRVSSTNHRAIAFYEKQLWINGGRDAHNPEMIVMQKALLFDRVLAV